MGFDRYAVDVASKIRPGAEVVLSRNRQKLFARAFKPLMPRIGAARRILDYGSGNGDLLLFLRAHSAAEIVGYDPSRSQRDLAHLRTVPMDRVHLVADPGEISGPFDLVFCLHVIEHIPDGDLDQFALSLASNLSTDGRLIISTPNGLNPFAYAYFMSTDRTHVRMHSPFTLGELFVPIGFEIESVHREIPQAYDFLSSVKTILSALLGGLIKISLHATAAGIRGLRFPLITSPTFFAVLRRSSPSGDGSGVRDK